MSEDVRLYAVKIPERLHHSGEGLEALQPFVSAGRREQILRFRHWSDKWRSLAGELLVRRVLRTDYGIGGERVQFAKNDFGKPQLIGIDLSFNLSHAGDWVVVAFDSLDVGVDVERIGSYDEAIARRFFSPEDRVALYACEGEARRHRFFELWTSKESYIKAVGCGLSMPMDAFALNVFADSGPTVYRDESGVNWHLCFYALDSAYKLALCARSSRLPGDVTEVAWHDLIVPANYV